MQRTNDNPLNERRLCVLVIYEFMISFYIVRTGILAEISTS